MKHLALAALCAVSLGCDASKLETVATEAAQQTCEQLIARGLERAAEVWPRFDALSGDPTADLAVCMELAGHAVELDRSEPVELQALQACWAAVETVAASTDQLTRTGMLYAMSVRLLESYEIPMEITPPAGDACSAAFFEAMARSWVPEGHSPFGSAAGAIQT